MCTSFRLKAQDSAVVIGRTMEFPNLMGAKLTVLPRGFAGAGIAPSGTGKSWLSEYGVVGVDAFGQPGWLTDGINEKGVYAGLLYMPGFCDYTPAEGKDPASCMSIVNTVAYVLGNCASVAEATAAMSEVTVWAWTVKGFGEAPAAHLVLHDGGGKSAVIEWRDGDMVIFDNPIGVATNSPHLDWHLLNLRNYLTLQATNPAPVTIEGVEVPVFGQGSGMRGLPAESSGPGRFVRAVAYVATLRPIPDAAGLEMSALHVLNNFDIPFGLIRADQSPEGDDHTLWSTISNLTDRRYAIRAYDSPVPQVIDLGATDFTPGEPRQAPLSSGSFEPLSV
jgi:choloylglycine hydrolase